MRELERNPSDNPADARQLPARLAIVGAGRAGGAIAAAASDAGIDVALLAREADHAAALADPTDTAVLLCVPDGEIAAACRRLASARPALIGHVSGATPLAALADAEEAGVPIFSMHPLQTIPTPETPLAGAPCAVAGSDERALAAARALATRLGMLPFEIPDHARATYHAAAVLASNFLVALEESAAGLLAGLGVEDAREMLAPLVLNSAANWAEHGAGALTGPIARGDEDTVAGHLQALRERAPELLPLYEALAERTRALVREVGT